ncbi:hypothetical protein Slala02_57770 [Streptomyces lavendulae subsp. lavendulae]|nr:hypothetical protein Slala01_61180 [Streptomyces lavendulae subsp. lavendulae]GLX29957.1 hypothetical protein Slala02_57770 [Streptomyces lavendulae subsp. lavendulae]
MVDLVVHETASCYAFARFGRHWRLCVIDHPRLGGELVPGGHTEDGEDPLTTAVREMSEETGHRVRLLPPPLPEGYPHPATASVWHVVSMPAAADSRCDRRHEHRDHLAVGVVDRPFAVHGTPEHTAHWVERNALDRLNLPEDTRVLASGLFETIDRVAAVWPRPAIDEALAAELLRRQEEDQAVRLVPVAERTPRLMERWRAVDEANTAWLCELIAARGWPGEALVGRQAAGAAWLIAQHADRQPEFQQECLELLSAAVTAGDADPQPGALLEDRVRIAQGQAQIFGTQLAQSPDGTLVPYPLANPDEVEALRAAWGFPPLETYIEQVTASAR